VSADNSTYVRARIDSQVKIKATDALAAMGLSVSDAIRLLMIRVAEEQRMPFEIRVPNQATENARSELETGKVGRFTTVKALMEDLDDETD
jgi:DNA-damage-inducible protein J